MQNCEACGMAYGQEAAFCPQCGTPLEGGLVYDSYEYAAFVSYRHLPHDSSVAMRLQRFVEGFTVPKGLRKGGFGKKVGKLFRDEDELPTSSSLSDQIRDALKRSHFLVVVCTPETRESLWVQREVELFASFHGRDRILVALASGEPEDSFPPLLLNRARRQADGTLAFEPAEPLAADFRPEAAGKFKSEALRVVAALLGCGYDDLKQRQRARRNALIARIGGAVAAASLAFAGVTLFQQAQILEKQHDLQVSQSRYLASEVDELLQRGDRMQAVQVALAALPESASSNDRPLVPEAQAALESAVRAYPTQDGWQPSFSRVENAAVDAYAVNEEAGKYAVVDSDQSVKVYDIASGAEIASFNLADVVDAGMLHNMYDSLSVQLWFSTPHRLIARLWQTSAIVCIDPSSASLVWSNDSVLEDWYADGTCVSADGSLICLAGTHSYFDDEGELVDRGRAVVLDAETGKIVHEYSQESEPDSPSASCAFSEDGAKLCFSVGTTLTTVGLSDDSIATGSLAYGSDTELSWLDGAVFATSANLDEAAPLPCAVQKFGADGKESWRVEKRVPTSRVGGIMYEGSALIWDILSERGGRGNEVLASFGGLLVAIDSETGGETSVADLVAPVVACRVTGDAPSQRIHVCSASGSVKYMTATEEEVSVGTDVDTEIGNTSEAAFVRPDDTTYLITLPHYSEAVNAKTAVFELFSTAALRQGGANVDDWSIPEELTAEEMAASAESLQDVLDAYGIAAGNVQFASKSPDGRKAVLQASGKVMKVDLSTNKVEASAIATFDGFTSGGFADDGRLFYAQCPIAGDYYGRSTLLVFDMEGEFFDPQSRIRFGVMLSDDATEVLIDDANVTRTATWSMPYFSIGELINHGSDLASGFELTKEQRESLYIEAA